MSDTSGDGPRTLRALIVDDEELARSVVREYCAGHDDLAVVGECANGFEGVKALEEHRPDLVFLDVQMPRLNGFEMLELVDEPPVVIFVTAYDSYAMKAFEVHACDYLQKPFSRERFDEALERARKRLHQRSWQVDASEYARVYETARDPDIPLRRVAVRRGGNVQVLPVRDIDVLEARDDYVRLHVGEQEWLKQKTLSWFESHLDDGAFLRVHRSYIINLSRLRTVEAVTKDSHVAVLETGQRVPVSKSGYKRLRERLE